METITLIKVAYSTALILVTIFAANKSNSYGKATFTK